MSNLEMYAKLRPNQAPIDLQAWIEGRLRFPRPQVDAFGESRRRLQA